MGHGEINTNCVQAVGKEMVNQVQHFRVSECENSTKNKLSLNSLVDWLWKCFESESEKEIG